MSIKFHFCTALTILSDTIIMIMVQMFSLLLLWLLRHSNDASWLESLAIGLLSCIAISFLKRVHLWHPLGTHWSFVIMDISPMLARGNDLNAPFGYALWSIFSRHSLPHYRDPDGIDNTLIYLLLRVESSLVEMPIRVFSLLFEESLLCEMIHLRKGFGDPNSFS